MTRHRSALKAIQKAIEPIRGAVNRALADDAAPDPIPDTAYHDDYELSVNIHWNWSKGDPGSHDTPADPAGAEDVSVTLGGHDITAMVPESELRYICEELIVRRMEEHP